MKVGLFPSKSNSRMLLTARRFNGMAFASFFLQEKQLLVLGIKKFLNWLRHFEIQIQTFNGFGPEALDFARTRSRFGATASERPGSERPTNPFAALRAGLGAKI
jgi:hypothetical protein